MQESKLFIVCGQISGGSISQAASRSIQIGVDSYLVVSKLNTEQLRNFFNAVHPEAQYIFGGALGNYATFHNLAVKDFLTQTTNDHLHIGWSAERKLADKDAEIHDLCNARDSVRARLQQQLSSSEYTSQCLRADLADAAEQNERLKKQLAARGFNTNPRQTSVTGSVKSYTLIPTRLRDEDIRITSTLEDGPFRLAMGHNEFFKELDAIPEPAPRIKMIGPAPHPRGKLEPYKPYEGPLVMRDEAIQRGMKKFFNGRPCPKGHVSQRYVSQSACTECAAQARAIWRHIPKART